MKLSPVLLAVLGFGCANFAQASVYDLIGTTAGKSSIVVPFADGNSGPQSYDAFQFQVSTDGSYGLVSTAAYDNYTLLYQGSFSAASPLNNLIAVNDDYQDSTHSALSFFFRTGTNYVFVNTAYEGSGAFTSTISGPGTVLPVLTAVPEPASVALLLSGLGVVVPFVRKRLRVPLAPTALG